MPDDLHDSVRQHYNRDLRVPPNGRDGSNPRPWPPSGVYSLVGRLKEVEERQRPSGPIRVAYVEEEPEGEQKGERTWAVWIHDHLARQWDALTPVPGDRIGVIYHGLYSEEEGRVYRRYTLLSERTGAVHAEKIDTSKLFDE